jgi:phage regulator Rha-like protein
MQASNESTSREVAPIQFNGAPTMSSREIADLVEKRHDVTKLSMERLAERRIIDLPPLVEYLDSLGRPAAEYRVVKRDSYVVVAQLSPEFTARLVDRWQELEANQQKFDPSVLTRMDILQLAMESEAGRIKAEAERDSAIATKALIGSKREATAMATASAAKREVARLQDKLGVNTRHATITAVENSTGREYPWNPLRKWCKANCVSVEKVADPRFGVVNTWPRDAWMEVYGIDLAEQFGQQEVA